MSATRDKSQKTLFVYSNMYQIYRKGKDAATRAEVPVEAGKEPGATLDAPAGEAGLPSARASSPGLTRGPLGQEAERSHFELPTSRNVLKSQNFKDPAPSLARVEPYNPPELLGARLGARAGARSSERMSDAAIQSLRQNIQTLNDLHARLRFMLQELEELVKS